MKRQAFTHDGEKIYRMIYSVNIKQWSSVLLLFVLAAFILSASCSRNRSTQQVEPSARLTFAAYKGDVSALVYLADEFGYYRERGLEVTIMVSRKKGRVLAERLS